MGRNYIHIKRITDQKYIPFKWLTGAKYTILKRFTIQKSNKL